MTQARKRVIATRSDGPCGRRCIRTARGTRIIALLLLLLLVVVVLVLLMG